ncbi:MAG: hypothetical protein RI922_2555 [Bacteroidota bacterium]
MNSALGFGQEAVFFCKKSSFKFPKTHEGVVLEHTFLIKNTGDLPLKLLSYEVECDCTKAFLPASEIKPGESVEVKVTFDTEGKAYFQDREIRITSNTKKKIEKLRIKVNVIPHV